MQKITHFIFKQVALFFFIFLWNNNLCAQSKHALLIGINNYYKIDSNNKVVLDASNTLKGCVNDAKSIKELLISRFSFHENEITELYDSSAYKQHILNELNTLLKKSDSGDVVFIYYSGHGYTDKWGIYQYNTAEMICPSDIFTKIERKSKSKKYYSSIQFTDLVRAFNLFVEKKVVLTTVFDCCFSFGTNNSDTVMYQDTKTINNSWTFDLSNEKEEDVITEEKNRMPENNDQQLQFINNYSETELQAQAFTIKYKELIYKDINDNKKKQTTDTNKIKFPIVIFNEIRPSKKEGSKFLFLSATNDLQKAAEKTDESGLRHGVLTKAILNVFKKESPDINSKEIFKNINQQFSNQFIAQKPQLLTSDLRSTQNFLGIDDDSINRIITVKCIRVVNDSIIILNKGLFSGLSVGNTLTQKNNPKITAKIIELISQDSCKAKIANSSNSSLKSDQLFSVQDWFTESKNKFLSIYIPNDGCSMATLNSIYTRLVKPLLSDIRLLPYEKSDLTCSKIYISNDGKSLTYIDGKTKKITVVTNPTAKSILKLTKQQNYFIYLPVPALFTNQIRKACEKNQNFVLVNDPKKAMVSLFCSYFKNLKNVVSCNYIALSSAKFSINVGNIPSNLLLVASNENAGANKNKSGHLYTAIPPYVLKENNIPIATVFVKWFSYNASKNGWLNDDLRK
ncbi:MAG TPA: caspase family protein [Chitinophagales bacterium]|nr:caspase family protein [Chitinophagales bacterium]